jgi:hypothetical protein
MYTPATDQLFKMFVPHPPAQSLAEIIFEKKGIQAEEIDQVIFRHQPHWARLIEVMSTGIIPTPSPHTFPKQLCSLALAQ